MSLSRDEFGIIGQPQVEDPNVLDMGDAAFSTGIMAFSGSVKDLFLMRSFIINGKLVRHPFQERWNKPELTSRDQVIAFFSALYVNKNLPESFDPVVKSCLSYAQSWWVNSDILMPADKFYLYKCAGAKPPMLLYPFAYLNQFLSLIWDCFIKSDHEMNQSICKNIVFGKRWIRALYKYHPNLHWNITEYYSFWRQKEEMGVALFNHVEWYVK